MIILYLNEATEGAIFMSYGRSFQVRIVEEKKELESANFHSLIQDLSISPEKSWTLGFP